MGRLAGTYHLLSVSTKDAPPDPWEQAKARQRDEVAQLFASRAWHCTRCGSENPPTRATCEKCGAPRVERVRRFERGKRAYLVIGLVAVAVTVGAILVVPGLRDSADEERRAQERALAARVAAERERLARDVVPKRQELPRRRAGEDPLEHRGRAVAAIEAFISADARARVAAGQMEGPVAGTSCSPYPRTDTRAQAEADPDLDAARYDCVAFRRRVQLPELEGRSRTGLLGQPFWAVADYGAGQVTWCKVTPRAGEGGRVLAFVPVPEPCRDPEGPG